MKQTVARLLPGAVIAFFIAETSAAAADTLELTLATGVAATGLISWFIAYVAPGFKRGRHALPDQEVSPNRRT